MRSSEWGNCRTMIELLGHCTPPYLKEVLWLAFGLQKGLGRDWAGLPGVPQQRALRSQFSQHSKLLMRMGRDTSFRGISQTEEARILSNHSTLIFVALAPTARIVLPAVEVGDTPSVMVRMRVLSRHYTSFQLCHIARCDSLFPTEQQTVVPIEKGLSEVIVKLPGQGFTGHFCIEIRDIGDYEIHDIEIRGAG